MPLLQTNSINETKSKLDYIVCANGIITRFSFYTQDYSKLEIKHHETSHFPGNF